MQTNNFKLNRAYIVFLLMVLSYQVLGQNNISVGTRELANINYSVHDIIGDNFLGSEGNPSIKIEHSILSGQLNSILSVDDFYIIEASIYPNPFSTNLKFDIEDNSDYIIQIMNNSGQEIKKINSRGITSINTNELPKGLYLVTIVDKSLGTRKTFELIKL